MQGLVLERVLVGNKCKGVDEWDVLELVLERLFVGNKGKSVDEWDVLVRGGGAGSGAWECLGVLGGCLRGPKKDRTTSPGAPIHTTLMTLVLTYPYPRGVGGLKRIKENQPEKKKVRR